MRLEGKRELAAPRDAVFRALLAPELLADALPVVGSVAVRDADHWTAEIKVPLLRRAPRLRFAFEVVERREPEAARLHASGRTLGGSVRVETSFTLEEAPDGRTAMSWEAEARLGGLLAHVGEAALRPVANGLVAGLLRAVERRAREAAAAAR